MRKTATITLLSFVLLFSSLFVNVFKAEAAINPQRIITEAKKFIGTPYKFGGTSPSGFDCSGFVYYTHKRIGKTLPRSSTLMFQRGSSVHKSHLRPGDLVFFSTYKKGASHVAIYIGNNLIIHATSKGVTIDNLNSAYWSSKFIGAKRVV
ncbi:C40 family peptidase [Anoxybacteroides amylolyticum]|uniref:NlpC/P60 family protein n=1 Tax=Anoxybacteroides amylolyticum TaxID=294699 RepID=A0A167TJP1_9BACL|nr:C40 family peptidase [Anoxybacillus amylolyticus]ANB61074.1 nlpC/P60 family protein [Anoxybacillus amylolyticus]